VYSKGRGVGNVFLQRVTVRLAYFSFTPFKLTIISFKRTTAEKKGENTLVYTGKHLLFSAMHKGAVILSEKNFRVCKLEKMHT
jgi:hypothetical protein